MVVAEGGPPIGGGVPDVAPEESVAGRDVSAFALSFQTPCDRSRAWAQLSWPTCKRPTHTLQNQIPERPRLHHTETYRYRHTFFV